MLTLILVTSLAIIGLHYCFQFDLTQIDRDGVVTARPINKEILWFVKYYLHVWIKDTWAKWLLKPLCDCIVCMSSVYGSIFYWLDFHYSNDVLNVHTIILWVAFLAAVAGLNRVLYKFLIS